jgi:prepilin-type N-terminal cleavage/methylation domain-containing protein
VARKLKRGLTLIEVIVSLLILSLVLILVLNLFPSSMAAARQGEQIVCADTIASSILDECAGKPYSQLVVGVTYLEERKFDNVVYRPRIEVLEFVGYDPDNLKGLRATVEWDVRGQTRESVHELWVANVRR